MGKSDDSYPRTESKTVNYDYLKWEGNLWGTCKGDFTYGYILGNSLNPTDWWKTGNVETHEFCISNYNEVIQNGNCLTPGYIYWKITARPLGNDRYAATIVIDVREANKFDPPHLIVQESLLGSTVSYNKDAYPLEGIQGDRFYRISN